MRLYAFVIAIVLVLNAKGANRFDDFFADSTLRVDYLFGADAERVSVFLDKQVKMPGWAGRRNRLTELPYESSG